MKNLIFLLFTIFISLPVLAQQKGASPIIVHNSSLITSSTYAVVVGISNYQDPGIPDLRFADKDAEAFANFLRSEAGGKLDGDHLKVLINSKATMAQFAIQLDWLMENAKENDQVFIYFSGHGDVEKKTIAQPGYLLCWDAPARVYLAGGALALPMFQDVISTLSTQNKVKVVVITDACHSGKLSGSSINGSQATSGNLAKQYANEIKILSCQPNEFSIEGEQWGGGRGAFSYHLIDALYGMADNNNDQSVTAFEIGRYLEDHVTAEVAPQSQLPLIVGNKTEKLTSVFPELLAQVKKSKNGQLPVFAATESRGIEEEVLAAVDTSIRRIYALFINSLKEKRFFNDPQLTSKSNPACAETYYKILSLEPGLSRLHSTIKRNYAAALQDDAQQVLNSLLHKGIDKVLTNAEHNGSSYSTYPKQLERAAELLGKDNYFYRSLIGRKLFFESFLTSNTIVSMEKCRQSLIYIPEFPLAYWRMANIQRWRTSNIDSSLIYIKKTIETSPGWIRPYTDYALFSTNRDSSRTYFKKAFDLDSTSAVLWYSKGLVYSNYYHQMDSAAMAYEKAIGAATQDGICFPCAYMNLSSYWENKGETKRAIFYLKEGLKMDSFNVALMSNLGNFYCSLNNFDSAIYFLRNALRQDPTHFASYSNLTAVYFKSKNYSAGLKACREAIIQINKLSSEKNDMSSYSWANIYENYADILNATHHKDQAFLYYKLAFPLFLKYNDSSALGRVLGNLILLDSSSKEILLLKFNIEVNKLNYPEILNIGKKLLQIDSTQLFVLDWTASTYMEMENFSIAIKYYNMAVCVDPKNKKWWNNLGNSYLHCKLFNQAKMALEKAIAIDSVFPNPYKHLGMVYFKMNRLQEAKENLQKAVQLNPNYYKALLGLGYCSIAENDPSEALYYIEQAIQNGCTYDQVKEDIELFKIQALPEWQNLMKKYFPDQFKDKK
ncbi:MAG: tetratricopeptide repeat protein [Saprospiraceae bacterium]